MHCNVCPVYPLVDALVKFQNGDFYPPRIYEAFEKINELSRKCIACHKRALKCDRHFSYDNDGGRLHGEISFNDLLFAPGQEQGEFTTDPDYLAARRRDVSTGCTDLSPEVEDLLRKVLAVIVEGVEPKDALVLLALLKREPLASARPKKMERREFVGSVHRVLRTLDRAKTIIKRGDARLERPDKAALALTRQATAKLIAALCSMLTPLDAPILLGMMKGMSLADTARAAGLKNRATAHARARSMLVRMPQLKSLHGTAAK